MSWFTVNVYDVETGDCVATRDVEAPNCDFAISMVSADYGDDYEFECL